MVVGKDYSALRASPFGSLPAATLSAGARVEPWSKLLVLPRLGRNLITDSFESSGTFESDGGGGGFEPSKSMTADLQSAPFGRSEPHQG